MTRFRFLLFLVVATLVTVWLTLPLLPSFADDAPMTHPTHAAFSHQHTDSKPLEKILYSEYNHHMAGLCLLLIGVTAMVMELGLTYRPDLKVLQWLWPVGWMAMGTFLFVRSDPDNWPWGPIGVLETFSDAETLQHKIFSMMVLIIGTIEGWQIAGRSNGHRFRSGWRLAFPVVAMGAGLLLGMHSFVHAHAPHIFWQHLTFAAVGILIGATKLLHDLAILKIGCRALVWPALIIVFAAQLILYTERWPPFLFFGPG
jgi:putative copper resistance protein D